MSAMTEADWPEVAAIYQEGIDTGHATFAPHPPESWKEWAAHKINACSLVARAGNEILYRCGFWLVGVREKKAKMEFGPCKGQWRDVLLLERRSKIVGV